MKLFSNSIKLYESGTSSLYQTVISTTVLSYDTVSCINHSAVVSVLASSTIDYGFESPGRVKPKTIKLVFVASPLSIQH